jgi:hypothetical protein
MLAAVYQASLSQDNGLAKTNGGAPKAGPGGIAGFTQQMAARAVTARSVASTSSAPPPCKTDLDCSLNGKCAMRGESTATCACFTPWKGPRCGVLAYAVTPTLARDLYPFNNTGAATQPTTSLNTWSGQVVKDASDGTYHFFNPIYERGSLFKVSAIMHGVASFPIGPYDWFTKPHLAGRNNPAALAFKDPNDGNKTKYTLWDRTLRIAESLDGPWESLGNNGAGANAAPVFHDGKWYVTNQHTEQVWTAPALAKNMKWKPFATINVSNVLPMGVKVEDPFMFVDPPSRGGGWHIINHAYNPNELDKCASSIVSTHTFSPDGKAWHMLSDPHVEPYSHTVQYDDGTSHTYATLERPSLIFNDDGVPIYLNLAADMVTGDAGCKERTNASMFCKAATAEGCACVNCKYGDHAGSTMIKLAVA